MAIDTIYCFKQIYRIKSINQAKTVIYDFYEKKCLNSTFFFRKRRFHKTFIQALALFVVQMYRTVVATARVQVHHHDRVQLGVAQPAR